MKREVHVQEVTTTTLLLTRGDVLRLLGCPSDARIELPPYSTLDDGDEIVITYKTESGHTSGPFEEAVNAILHQ